MWFDWVQDLFGYPTVLSFAAAAVAYGIDPGLASDKTYLVVTMLVIVWGLTFVNFALVPSINISYSTLSALTTRSS